MSEEGRIGMYEVLCDGVCGFVCVFGVWGGGDGCCGFGYWWVGEEWFVCGVVFEFCLELFDWGEGWFFGVIGGVLLC